VSQSLNVAIAQYSKVPRIYLDAAIIKYTSDQANIGVVEAQLGVIGNTTAIRLVLEVSGSNLNNSVER
jgi:pantothenate kinase type III